jgi:putative modified peptide
MSEEGEERKAPLFDIEGVTIDIPEDKFSALIDKLVTDKRFRDQLQESPAEAFRQVGIPISPEVESAITKKIRDAFTEAHEMESRAQQPAAPELLVLPVVVVAVRVAVQSRVRSFS